MADNTLFVNTASIAVGTITDASGVGLVPSASHAVYSDTAGNVTTADTASYVAGSNVDGAVASATSASHALVADFTLGLPKYKAGVVAGASFDGSPMTYTVEFTTPFDDDNYAPSVVGGNNRGFTCESVVSGSFIISTNSAQALDEPVYWVAIATGESN